MIQEYININRDYNQPTSPLTRPSSPANFGGVSLKFFVPKQGAARKYQQPQRGYGNELRWCEIPHARRQRTDVLGRTSQGWEIRGSDRRHARSGCAAPRKRIRVPRPAAQGHPAAVTIISDGRFVDTSATSLYSEGTEGWQVNRRNGGPLSENV